MDYVTTDSGVRHEYASGMVRDTQTGKARPDLLVAEKMPYADQFLTRWDGYNGAEYAEYDGSRPGSQFGESLDAAEAAMRRWLSADGTDAHMFEVATQVTAGEYYLFRDADPDAVFGYEQNMITRLSFLMARGAEKYGDRNWEKGCGIEEYVRARTSAARHLGEWIGGLQDGQDHASAVLFNLISADYFAWRMRQMGA